MRINTILIVDRNNPNYEDIIKSSFEKFIGDLRINMSKCKYRKVIEEI